jgi:hypothetical protein
MRQEFYLPLIISCGAKKIDIPQDHKIEAYKLYSKGLWAIFRGNSPQLPMLDIPVYVLSAKYGIIPHDQKIETYNKKIQTGKITNKQLDVPIEDVVKKIKQQWNGDKKVLFSGYSDYKQALEEAGFTVYDLQDFSDFPLHMVRGGSGKSAGALKWFLESVAPKIIEEKKITKLIIENLPQRFSKEKV